MFFCLDKISSFRDIGIPVNGLPKRHSTTARRRRSAPERLWRKLRIGETCRARAASATDGVADESFRGSGASFVVIDNDGDHLPFPEMGMVTGALWSDADGGGWIDPKLTIEWGAVRFFKNGGGQLVDRTEEAQLDKRLGWWNGIAYVVTNFGLNTKYSESPENPALLFYGDLDASGKAHLVEAKLDGGKLLPRRGFSVRATPCPS